MIVVKCTTTLHPEYKKYSCGLEETRCVSNKRECSAYDTTVTVGTETFYIDNCSDLYAGDGKRCAFTKTSPTACEAQYIDCKSDLTGTSCTNNIPSDYSQKCIHDGSICKKETRQCKDEDTSYISHIMNDELCKKLAPTNSNSGKKCFLVGGTCGEHYEKCSSYKGEDPETDCIDIIPLKTDNDYAFENWYKCSPNGNTCKSEKKTCREYKESDGSGSCPNFLSTDENKVCFYELGSGCIEKYKTCTLFFKNAATKTQETCESFTPPGSSKHCVWKRISDTTGECEEEKVYSSCGEYKGNDKETCECILGGGKCILDKDTTCIEKIIYCTDATKINDCSHAKAKSDKKNCIFTSDRRCIENYKKCEDYVGNNKATCEAIIQFNGKKCVFDSTGCKPYNKICTEATTEEECKLIAKMGVSDPERKVCDYYSGCFENYKYCSDYREIDPSATLTTVKGNCLRIKPYDSSGNNIDITSECEYKEENNVGCQRKLANCNKATTDEECQSISTKLESSTNYYCAFIGGQCKKYYKTCELYDEEEDAHIVSSCGQNIPKDYDNNYCELESSECKTKKKTCNSFLKNYEETLLCSQIGPFCIYTSSSCKNMTINSCSEIVISTFPNLNEEICNAFKIEDSNIICSLKADKLGCEEKDPQPQEENQEPEQDNKPTQSSENTPENSPTGNPESQGDASGLRIYGISLIITFLCLLN